MLSSARQQEERPNRRAPDGDAFHRRQPELSGRRPGAGGRRRGGDGNLRRTARPGRRGRNTSVFAEVGGAPAGIAHGPDGSIYVCNNGSPKMVRETLADGRTA